MFDKRYTEVFISKWFYFIIIFFIMSCSGNMKKESSFTISGQIKYTTGMKAYLQELDLQDIKTLDSVVIGPQGKFSFTYSPADQGFYLLKLQNGRLITLLLNKGENVTIKGDLKSFPRNFEVSGSRESMLLEQFYDHTTMNKEKGDSLMDVLHTHQYASDYYKITISFDTLFQGIWQDQRKFEKNFIDKNIRSLASLLVLNYTFGPRPVLSKDEDFAYYLKVDSSMMKSFPTNKHVIYHHKRITEYQRQMNIKKPETTGGGKN
jgi:hypothetical protein